ncbi:hypothetical protein GCM10010971_09100 [Silvimonas amylolytica]|uniref:Fimbrial-type adhesion domain-containing protein n=2 Tax=Silvimonas amylolytica TaxID=449663 RepID=A0ABQ2PI91_9NEIS|nr:hypothetical protein GCM10010971_09100 [Silvimonas amylolytica]
MKSLLMGLVVALLAGYAVNSHAAPVSPTSITCTYTGGASIPMPPSISITTDTDALPNGSLLSAWSSAIAGTARCALTGDGATIITSLFPYIGDSTGQVVNVSGPDGITYPFDVFQTGIPGIGFIVYYTGHQKSQRALKALKWDTPVAPDWNIDNAAQASTSGRLGTDTLNVTVGAYVIQARFVKIGTIKKGVSTTNLSALTLHYDSWVTPQNNNVFYYYPTFSGFFTIPFSSTTFNVQVPTTCAVNSNSTNLNIDLPSVKTVDFDVVNSVAKKTAFNINLQNCVKQPVISMTVSALADTDSALPGVMKSTGSASGIGLQLVNNVNGTATPVTLGAAMNAGTVTGPDGSAYSIPMYVQYIKTKTDMTPGDVKAHATVTFSYD